ncbi:membrane protein YqaA, SNARE-associated domain [Aureimonas altamirensis DSM 21988]|uniref:Membrane protein YqaA, SNARE-associated domain n=1 Tax=Aureimonas altamirensis DSM 21988 TaxID=1121026 RepID=A0ABY1ICG7_9HYPH|nr:YqaA family protein [Aureimonas altamirensis]SHI97180.1 membrane protein YqaA, SNARE-associated domain [Aureimonas altamirensis DSM 21988]
MIRALYDWTLRLAAKPRANYALGAVSFADSSFFPVPPDILLIPMVIANRRRAWRLALICTLTSVLGAIAGYVIGAALFEQVARPILALYGYSERFAEFAITYNEYGAWIVLIAGLTPFPFKVVTIASGATSLDFVSFVLLCTLARGTRFYLVAGLLYAFGPPIRDFIERRLGLVFVVLLVLLIGGFAIRYFA